MMNQYVDLNTNCGVFAGGESKQLIINPATCLTGRQLLRYGDYFAPAGCDQRVIIQPAALSRGFCSLWGEGNLQSFDFSLIQFLGIGEFKFAESFIDTNPMSIQVRLQSSTKVAGYTVPVLSAVAVKRDNVVVSMYTGSDGTAGSVAKPPTIMINNVPLTTLQENSAYQLPGFNSNYVLTMSGVQRVMNAAGSASSLKDLRYTIKLKDLTVTVIVATTSLGQQYFNMFVFLDPGFFRSVCGLCSDWDLIRPNDYKSAFISSSSSLSTAQKLHDYLTKSSGCISGGVTSNSLFIYTSPFTSPNSFLNPTYIAIYDPTNASDQTMAKTACAAAGSVPVIKSTCENNVAVVHQPDFAYLVVQIYNSLPIIPVPPGDWVVGNWTACSESCGGGTMSRDIICSALGEVVNNYQCSTKQPIGIQICNTQVCPSPSTFPLTNPSTYPSGVPSSPTSGPSSTTVPTSITIPTSAVLPTALGPPPSPSPNPSAIPPTSAPVCTSSTDIKNFVSYIQYDYATLDDASSCSSNIGCQDSSKYFQIPYGWSIAPNIPRHRVVVTVFPFSTLCVIFADGSSISSELASCGANALKYFNNDVNCIGVQSWVCPARILITRRSLVVSPVIVNGSVVPNSIVGKMPVGWIVQSGDVTTDGISSTTDSSSSLSLAVSLSKSTEVTQMISSLRTYAPFSLSAWSRRKVSKRGLNFKHSTEVHVIYDDNSRDQFIINFAVFSDVDLAERWIHGVVNVYPKRSVQSLKIALIASDGVGIIWFDSITVDAPDTNIIGNPSFLRYDGRTIDTWTIGEGVSISHDKSRDGPFLAIRNSVSSQSTVASTTTVFSNTNLTSVSTNVVGIYVSFWVKCNINTASSIGIWRSVELNIRYSDGTATHGLFTSVPYNTDKWIFMENIFSIDSSKQIFQVNVNLVLKNQQGVLWFDDFAILAIYGGISSTCCSSTMAKTQCPLTDSLQVGLNAVNVAGSMGLHYIKPFKGRIFLFSAVGLFQIYNDKTIDIKGRLTRYNGFKNVSTISSLLVSYSYSGSSSHIISITTGSPGNSPTVSLNGVPIRQDVRMTAVPSNVGIIQVSGEVSSNSILSRTYIIKFVGGYVIRVFAHNLPNIQPLLSFFITTPLGSASNFFGKNLLDLSNISLDDTVVQSKGRRLIDLSSNADVYRLVSSYDDKSFKPIPEFSMLGDPNQQVSKKECDEQLTNSATEVLAMCLYNRYVSGSPDLVDVTGFLAGALALFPASPVSQPSSESSSSGGSDTTGLIAGFSIAAGVGAAMIVLGIVFVKRYQQKQDAELCKHPDGANHELLGILESGTGLNAIQGDGNLLVNGVCHNNSQYKLRSLSQGGLKISSDDINRSRSKSKTRSASRVRLDSSPNAPDTENRIDYSMLERGVSEWVMVSPAGAASPSNRASGSHHRDESSGGSTYSTKQFLGDNASDNNISKRGAKHRSRSKSRRRLSSLKPSSKDDIAGRFSPNCKALESNSSSKSIDSVRRSCSKSKTRSASRVRLDSSPNAHDSESRNDYSMLERGVSEWVTVSPTSAASPSHCASGGHHHDESSGGSTYSTKQFLGENASDNNISKRGPKRRSRSKSRRRLSSLKKDIAGLSSPNCNLLESESSSKSIDSVAKIAADNNNTKRTARNRSRSHPGPRGSSMKTSECPSENATAASNTDDRSEFESDTKGRKVKRRSSAYETGKSRSHSRSKTSRSHSKSHRSNSGSEAEKSMSRSASQALRRSSLGYVGESEPSDGAPYRKHRSMSCSISSSRKKNNASELATVSIEVERKTHGMPPKYQSQKLSSPSTPKIVSGNGCRMLSPSAPNPSNPEYSSDNNKTEVSERRNSISQADHSRSCSRSQAGKRRHSKSLRSHSRSEAEKSRSRSRDRARRRSTRLYAGESETLDGAPRRKYHSMSRSMSPSLEESNYNELAVSAKDVEGKKCGMPPKYQNPKTIISSMPKCASGNVFEMASPSVSSSPGTRRKTLKSRRDKSGSRSSSENGMSRQSSTGSLVQRSTRNLDKNNSESGNGNSDGCHRRNHHSKPNSASIQMSEFSLSASGFSCPGSPSVFSSLGIRPSIGNSPKGVAPSSLIEHLLNLSSSDHENQNSPKLVSRKSMRNVTRTNPWTDVRILIESKPLTCKSVIAENPENSPHNIPFSSPKSVMFVAISPKNPEHVFT